MARLRNATKSRFMADAVSTDYGVQIEVGVGGHGRVLAFRQLGSRIVVTAEDVLEALRAAGYDLDTNLTPSRGICDPDRSASHTKRRRKNDA